MITDLLFSILMLTFVVAGFSRPHVALLGVIWVDTITPQMISNSFLTGKPLSMLLTLAFFGSVFLNFKKIKSPNSKLPLFFLVLLGLWMTMSTFQAHYQSLAWFKYGIVIKTIIISAFIPFVFNTRGKIELFMWVFIASVGFYIAVGGLKTLFGGGGYAVAIIQTRADNSGITETSTLSIMTIVAMAMMIYLYKYSLAAKEYKVLRWYLLFMMFIGIFSVVGTFARSGLIAGGLLAFAMFVLSKQKGKLTIYTLIGVMLLLPMMPQAWFDRMSTITKPKKEKSAQGRILVWRWTIDYALDNPILGGGFYAYIDNAGELQHYVGDGETDIEANPQGKAFHNMFFEVLGELGYAGLLIYLLYIFASMHSYWKSTRKKGTEEWLDYLAKMLAIASLIYFTGGMFVGIAYSPWFFYLMLLGQSLCNLQNIERKRVAQ